MHVSEKKKEFIKIGNYLNKSVMMMNKKIEKRFPKINKFFLDYIRCLLFSLI